MNRVVVIVCGFLLAGCSIMPADDGSAAGQTPLTVQELVESAEVGEHVRVATGLVTADGVPYLCDTVLDSYPVQPGFPKVKLLGAPLEDLELTAQREVMTGTVDVIVEIIDESTVRFIGQFGD